MTVTVADLKKIYTTSRSDDDLQVFLDSALLIVSEDLRPNCALSEERYDKITVYLAVHFLSLTDTVGNGSGQSGEAKRSKQGDADESYTAPANDTSGYASTRWGQMAIALDKCGILAGTAANSGIKALLRVV